jgi:hypothetical protein
MTAKRSWNKSGDALFLLRTAVRWSALWTCEREGGRERERDDTYRVCVWCVTESDRVREWEWEWSESKSERARESYLSLVHVLSVSGPLTCYAVRKSQEGNDCTPELKLCVCVRVCVCVHVSMCVCVVCIQIGGSLLKSYLVVWAQPSSGRQIA